MTPPADAQPVAVLGGGLMGHGIAQAFASAGVTVQIWDPDMAALASVPTRVRENLDRVARINGRPNDPDGTVERIRLRSNLDEAVSDASFVFEAAPENLVLKQDLLRQVEKANPTAIFASNTSVLRIGEIAGTSAHPDRVIGAHWWNPPYLIPVVEVVPCASTTPEVTTALVEYLVKIRKQPVLVRADVPGFIGNRLQFALWREALHLVESGVCDAEAVDTVVRNTLGLRLASMGPMENADFIGLDLVDAIMTYVLPNLATGAETPQLVREAVADGRLGAKSGEGLFAWEPGQRDRVQDRLTSGIVRAIEGSEGA